MGESDHKSCSRLARTSKFALQVRGSALRLRLHLRAVGASNFSRVSLFAEMLI